MNNLKVESFRIGKTEFGISDEKLIQLSDNTLSLVIVGQSEKFDTLSDDEGGPWNWALYPPKFYMQGVPIEQEDTWELTVDDTLLDDFDVAIYMIEHNDVFGILNKTTELLSFSRKVDLFGEREPLDIVIRL